MTDQKYPIPLPLTNCNECTLKSLTAFAPYVYSGNPVSPKLLVITEVPGNNARQKDHTIPLINDNDTILRRVLEKYGFDVDNDVFVTHVVLCNPIDPKKKKRKSTQGEKKNCKCNLEAVLAYFKDKIRFIVPLGDVAMKAVSKASKITQDHGSIIETPYGKVFPLYSPGYISLNPHLEDVLEKDVEYLKQLCDGTYTKPTDDSIYDIVGYTGYAGHYLNGQEKKLLNPLNHFDKVCDLLEQHDILAVDIETTGLYVSDHEIIGISFSHKSMESFYIPLLVLNPDESFFLSGGADFDLEFQKNKFLASITGKNVNIQEAIDAFTLEFNKRKLEFIEQELQQFEVIVGYEKERDKKDDKTKKTFKEYTAYKFWGDKQEKIINRIKKIVFNKDLKVIGANYKFDQKHMYFSCNGFEHNLKYDVGILSYLLNENQSNSIKALAEKHYPEKRNYEKEKDQYLNKTELKAGFFIKVPLQLLGTYGATDTDITYRLYEKLYPKVNSNPKFKAFYENIYMVLNKSYLEAEINKIRVDMNHLDAMREYYENFIVKIEEYVIGKGGKEFELSSPMQVGKFLFDHLGIPHLGWTSADKKQYKTDKETLNLIADQHELVPYIQEHRGIRKMLDTYIYSIYRDNVDGYIDFQTLLYGTVTGRFSFKRYPIQTVPRKKEIRNIFLPPPGYYWVDPDYSQIELRILAWFCKDPVLLDAYLNNKDLHSIMAQTIYNEPFEVVKADVVKRTVGKTTNFGTAYGAYGQTLATQINENLPLGVPRVNAEFGTHCKNSWYNTYSYVQPWKEEVWKFCRKHKYVENPLGRKRRLPNINHQEDSIRAENERYAVNALISGFADDLRKISEVRLYKLIKQIKSSTRIMFSMHDGLPMAVTEDELPTMVPKIKETMEDTCVSIDTPVDITVSHRWKGKEITI